MGRVSYRNLANSIIGPVVLLALPSIEPLLRRYLCNKIHVAMLLIATSTHANGDQIHSSIPPTRRFLLVMGRSPPQYAL